MLYPKNALFVGRESYSRADRARREPLSGAASCAIARDGARRARGADSIRKGDLLSTLLPPISLLHGNHFFRRRRGRSAFPPEPGDLLTTYDRQHGEKLYRFERIPRVVRIPGAPIDNAGWNRRECLPARRWGSSSAGRAPRSQRGGREFNPPLLHHPSLLRSFGWCPPQHEVRSRVPPFFPSQQTCPSDHG